MLFANALDTHKPIEAKHTGQRALCPDPLCNCIMMSRCSDDKDYTNHWYGFHNNDCVSHWEEMSDWHYNWQNTISNPIGGKNVEVIINGKDRYKRADLLPDHGIIIEFQKSSISYNAVKEREQHYKRMMWVLHEDRTFTKYIQRCSANGTTEYIKKTYPRKAWYKNQNLSIPIFIDHGEYLTGDCLLSGTISKPEFIKRYINSNYLPFETLCSNYWNNISNSFDFFNNIIPKIEEAKRQLALEKMRLENERIEELKRDEYQRAYFQKIEELKREQEEENQRWVVSQLTYALFDYFITCVNARIQCGSNKKNFEASLERERKLYRDPQYFQIVTNIIANTKAERECDAINKHLVTIESNLKSRLKFENWKQVVKKIDMPSLVNANITPTIEARIKSIELLELQRVDFEKKGIPTFKTETEILKLKREISNLTRVKS